MHVISPEDMASAIFQEHIMNVEADIEAFSSALSATTAEISWAFVERIRLYKMAAIIVGFHRAAQVDPSWDPVMRAFARLAAMQPMDKREAFERDLEQAISDLQDLLDEDRKQLSWAMRWLKSCGWTEDNPVRLMLVSIRWMDLMILTMKLRTEVGISPVAS